MKQSIQGPLLALLFLGTFIAELLVLTVYAGKPSLSASPVIWLALGIVNAWTGSLLITRYGPGVAEFKKADGSVFSIRTLLGVLVFAAGVWYAGNILWKVFQEIPEINNMSDILPGKREFIRRFLAGETVYLPVQFDSYALQPTFLPFRWLPFVIAELLHFDYRWIPYAGFVVGVGCWFFSSASLGTKSKYWEIILKGILPFLLLGKLVVDEKLNFALAVELLIVGYHLILARYVFNKSPWIVGLSLVLCLLSRYSIVLWLALPAYWLIMQKQYVFLKKLVLITLGGILLFYYLPFCLHDMGQHFLNASKYYVDACFGCWRTDSWLPPGSVPNTFLKGSGFQIWAYEYGPGDLSAKYKLNANLGLASCAATIAVFGYLLHRHIKTKNDPIAIQGILLSSLKVYMMFFIGFILCPFNYLFAVPLFLSLPLFYSISFSAAFSNSKRCA